MQKQPSHWFGNLVSSIVWYAFLRPVLCVNRWIESIRYGKG